MSSRPALFWAGALALLALPVVSLAAEPPCPAPVPGEVRVSVVAILATERSDKIDKCLEPIAREVQKKNPRLKGFRRVHVDCKPVVIGKTDTFELVADQVALVKVLRGNGKGCRVCLKVTAPRVGGITYETCCGKFLPIVTRFRTKDKDLLIIAVRVQPCPGK